MCMLLLKTMCLPPFVTHKSQTVPSTYVVHESWREMNFWAHYGTERKCSGFDALKGCINKNKNNIVRISTWIEVGSKQSLCFTDCFAQCCVNLNTVIWMSLPNVFTIEKPQPEQPWPSSAEIFLLMIWASNAFAIRLLQMSHTVSCLSYNDGT